MKLQETAMTPLYQQIVDDLKSQIELGEFAAFEKVPSELELSEKYSVSRITVRRAIEELASEGLVTKKQGKGTYVNPPKISRKIMQTSEVESFTDTCKNAGKVAGAQLISATVEKPNKKMAQFLGLADDDQVIHIKRLRTADELPIMLENNYFPKKDFDFLLTENLEDVSIFSLAEKKTQRKVKDSERCTLEIQRAIADDAKLLQVAVGEPLFCENVYFLDDAKKPFIVGKQLIVGKHYVFDI